MAPQNMLRDIIKLFPGTAFQKNIMIQENKNPDHAHEPVKSALTFFERSRGIWSQLRDRWNPSETTRRTRDSTG